VALDGARDPATRQLLGRSPPRFIAACESGNCADGNKKPGPPRNQTLTIDDSSATSLYLLNDEVADAVAYLQAQGKIQVSSVTAGIPFPRATGTPGLLHGDGSPEGLVYAPYGSVYLRRDAMGPSALFSKTTSVAFNTGWVQVAVGAVKPAKLSFSNTATESDLFGTQGSGGELRRG
jgi:hypothetical protein